MVIIRQKKTTTSSNLITVLVCGHAIYPSFLKNCEFFEMLTLIISSNDDVVKHSQSVRDRLPVCPFNAPLIKSGGHKSASAKNMLPTR